MRHPEIQAMSERVEEESRFVESLLTELHKLIVGQEVLLQRLLVGLLADGHILIEGVPGLAKTTAVRALARSLQVQFQRIQFTPDLLPADLLGTLIYQPREGTFTVKKGPIFANVILADEINRAPAKVQSALLEAMQERQVTLGDHTYPLEEPFLVLATQNPIEQEGTYPLPEAQVDRFMLKLQVRYPTREEELQILRQGTGKDTPEVQPVVAPEAILQARRTVREIYMDERIERYIVDLVFATREPQSYGLAELEPLIDYGASPRATIYLALASKAHAFLHHRAYVIPDDVRAIGTDVLRHRVLLSYEAEAEERTPEDILEQIFHKIAVP